MKAIFIILVGVLLLACVLLTALSCTARPPKAGLLAGRLRPCPDKPNCICSEDRQADAWVEPLTFQGPPTRAWGRLKAALQEMGGTIQRQSDAYIWATFSTKVFRFVDDVEFRMVAEENTIHVRSASRVGYSDLGLNKRRMEKLRSKLHEAMNDQNVNGRGPG
jgi:uncharacterized protein (DUF1499 family)